MRAERSSLVVFARPSKLTAPACRAVPDPVRLIQGMEPCVPCHLEGCEWHIDSYSDCLQQLPAARVISAVELLLDQKTA